MRKDSWFRGALLSVLIFFLVLGVPGATLGDEGDGGNDGGGDGDTGGGSDDGDDGGGSNDGADVGSPEWCEAAGKLVGVVAIDAAGAGILAALGAASMGPVGIALGILALGGGIYVAYNCA